MNLKAKVITASVLALTIQMAAAEQKNAASTFIGTEAGYATFSPKASEKINNDSFKAAPAGGIRLGTEIKDLRVYGTLTYGSFAPKQKNATGSADIWQLNLHTDFQYEAVKGLTLFAGPHAGLNMKAVNITPRGTKAGKKGYEGGFQFGLQAGAGYQFTKNLSTEAGYRFSWEKSFKKQDKYSSINQPYLAVNYHF